MPARLICDSVRGRALPIPGLLSSLEVNEPSLGEAL